MSLQAADEMESRSAEPAARQSAEPVARPAAEPAARPGAGPSARPAADPVPDPTAPRALPAEVVEGTIATLLARYPGLAERIRRGVEQVAQRWWPEDGDAQSFTAFCTAHFAADEAALPEIFRRMERVGEEVDGRLHEIRRELTSPLDLEGPDGGPPAPFDELLAGIDLAPHLEDDLFRSQAAFVLLLNFPVHTLAERLEQGPLWDRTAWARSRMMDRLALRVPAAVVQEATRAHLAADQYVAAYNIRLDRVITPRGRRLFPEGLRLISHWGLRDELAAHYAGTSQDEALERQRTIFEVMRRIVRQEIPARVIDNPELLWEPFGNRVQRAGEQASGAAVPAPETHGPTVAAPKPDLSAAERALAEPVPALAAPEPGRSAAAPALAAPDPGLSAAAPKADLSAANPALAAADSALAAHGPGPAAADPALAAADSALAAADPGRSGVDPALAAPEPDTRYAHLLAVFRGHRRIDAFSPSEPTFIARRFERDRQIPEPEVEALLESVLGSPEVARLARLIERRLGRPLEPFDIWYSGFKPRGRHGEPELDRAVCARYPTVEVFASALPQVLGALGFTAEKARWLAGRIAVDRARGAGHALGAVRRADRAHLRTRVPRGGMSYKGYNVALHELGHNVEQVFSLNAIDHWFLAGVPNNAFTEAFAFAFQHRDLELLGMGEEGPEARRTGALANLWNTYEIAGVSLVDMRVWHWMYDHPDAAPAELRAAVLAIAREIWNRWFLPHFGAHTRDSEALAVYSHMIAHALYLPDYAIGHIIGAQVAERMEGPGFGAEAERLARIGRLTPAAWMQAAVGEPISARALLASARAALRGER
jgi:hypothetical protein